MADPHSWECGFLKSPVDSSVWMPLSTIVSKGPPSLQARTGNPEAMASSGTIPKCSPEGVYSKEMAFLDCRSASFWVRERLGRKRTEAECVSGESISAKVRSWVAASVFSSLYVSMLFGRRESYPPIQ